MQEQERYTERKSFYSTKTPETSKSHLFPFITLAPTSGRRTLTREVDNDGAMVCMLSPRDWASWSRISSSVPCWPPSSELPGGRVDHSPSADILFAKVYMVIEDPKTRPRQRGWNGRNCGFSTRLEFSKGGETGYEKVETSNMQEIISCLVWV